MLTCRRVRKSVLLVAMVTALAPLLSGCENSSGQQATSGAPSPSPPAAPAAKTGNLPPGSETMAQDRAGDQSYDKTFDDLRFDIKPGDPFKRSMLPPAIEALDGQRMRIRGFILPTPQKRGIKTFVLVRDNQECCFGPGAALYDCILVEMAPGKTVEFSIWPVAVEGTFSINEVIGPDGQHWAIYRIDGEAVK